MATDQVAAKATGRRQRLLQIDLAAGFQADKSGMRQGFAADIGPETIARQLHGRQAYAVDRNAIAEFDVGEIQLAGRHIPPHVAPLGRQCADAANRFDYAGKHATPCVAPTAKHWLTTPEARGTE